MSRDTLSELRAYIAGDRAVTMTRRFLNDLVDAVEKGQKMAIEWSAADLPEKDNESKRVVEGSLVHQISTLRAELAAANAEKQRWWEAANSFDDDCGETLWSDIADEENASAKKARADLTALRAELAAERKRVEGMAEMVAEARSRPDALRADKAEAELAAAIEHVRNSDEACNRYAVERDTLRAELAAEKAAREWGETERGKLERIVNTLRAELSAANALAEQRLRGWVDEGKEKDALRAELAAEKSAREWSEAERTKLEKIVHTLRAENAAQRSDRKQLSACYNSLQADVDELRDKLAAVSKDLHAEQASHKLSRSEADEAEAERDAMRELLREARDNGIDDPYGELSTRIDAVLKGGDNG